MNCYFLLIATLVVFGQVYFCFVSRTINYFGCCCCCFQIYFNIFQTNGALEINNESELREAEAALFNVNSQSGW